MLTEKQANDIVWDLRRIMDRLERINGNTPSKLENLVRYAQDEAREERRRARDAIPALNQMERSDG